MSIKNKNFLIIAGQPKAGTTSLFNWIKKHPSITPSILKEERFFIDKEYPLDRRKEFNGGNLEEYLDLFPKKSNEFFLEACPDYLYNQTPLKISTLLPKSKIIIIIRDAESRMISAYNFFKQRGMINPNMTFKDYILYQHTLQPSKNTPIQFRALEQCAVNPFLEKWKRKFYKRLYVMSFDNLKENPLNEISKVCSFVGISDEFYKNFNFTVENKSMSSKYLKISKYYYLISDYFRLRFANNKTIMRFGKKISSLIKRKLHTNLTGQNIIVDEETRQILDKYENR